MNDVCECPGHRYWQERKAEEDVVNEAGDDDVRDPHPFAVEVRRIGVGIAVMSAHIHSLFYC